MSDQDIVASLGGLMCACSPEGNGHYSIPLAPGGACPECGTEGPLHRQAVLNAVARKGSWPGDPEPLHARYQKVSWETAYKEEPDDVQWLKPDFIERGSLAGLFSQPGVGKSLIVQELALELVRQGLTVLYVDDENRLTDIVDRMRAFGASWQELEKLCIYNFQGLPPLDTEEGGEHLQALALADQPDLIVLDTVSRMIKGNENDADTFLQLYRCSLTRLKRLGIAVLRLDHSGKDTTRGQRGSSAKESDLDVLWCLSRSDDDATFLLECQKSRAGHIPYGTMVTLTRSYEPLQHTWFVQIDMPERMYREIAEMMDRLSVPATAGVSMARKILRDNGVSMVRTSQLQAAILARRNRERLIPRPVNQCPF